MGGIDPDSPQNQAKAKVGKTSAFRILYTLDKLGYVEKDPATGKLGTQNHCRRPQDAGGRKFDPGSPLTSEKATGRV